MRSRSIFPRPCWRILYVVASVLCLSACSGAERLADSTTVRGESLSFNEDWSFIRLPAGTAVDPAELPTAGWSAADLPHTANLEPLVTTDQWQGDALYRKDFFAPDEWRERVTWIRFEGAMTEASVYVNGVLVKRHLGGYLPFTVDLTKHLQFGGENRVLVHLDNRDKPLAGPKPLKRLDFNTYGGLYREASLEVRDKLHITDAIAANEVAGGGVLVTYPRVATDAAVVSIQTQVRNADTVSRTFRIRHSLRLSGATVARTESDNQVLSPATAAHYRADLEVDRPRLWSPESPNLYELVTEVLDGDDTLLETRRERIGIRSFAFDGADLLVNGKKTFLRGVNRHQEYPYIGYALSREAQYRDALLIKEAGFDYVRLSHYPHSPHFMDAADELGLVLLDAILGWQYFNPDPAFADHVEQTCRDLIRRDRNHASVLAWECSLNESRMPPEFIKRLHTAVHEELPGEQTFSAGWKPIEFDIYLQARQHRRKHYKTPDRPYIVSEYGDWEYYAQNAGLNQDLWGDLSEEARTSRQLIESGERRLLQQALNIQEAHNDNFNVPAFADGYWVMFDYNRGYYADLEASGIMSIFRRPKFSYDFFRSQRDMGRDSSGAMVAIASYWTADSDLDVRVFSNAEQVELRLNGQVIARQSADRNRISNNLAHPPFTFAVPAFEPGELEAIAFVGEAVVARTVVRTPGTPRRLQLQLATHGVAIGTRDTVFAHATVVDADGTPVRDDSDPVRFEIVNCPGDQVGFIGPSVSPTRAGTASILLRITDPDAACELRASTEPGESADRPALHGATRVLP